MTETITHNGHVAEELGELGQPEPLDRRFADLVAELGRFRAELDETTRIRFGPAEGNTIPLDWVEPLLARLWAKHPDLLGRELMHLFADLHLDGQEWSVGKPRNRSEPQARD